MVVLQLPLLMICLSASLLLCSTSAAYGPQPLKEGVYHASQQGFERDKLSHKGLQSIEYMSIHLDSVVRRGLQWQSHEAPGAFLHRIVVANLRGGKLNSDWTRGTTVDLIFERPCVSKEREGGIQEVVWSFPMNPKALVQIVISAQKDSPLSSRHSGAFQWDEVIGSLASLNAARQGLAISDFTTIEILRYPSKIEAPKWFLVDLRYSRGLPNQMFVVAMAFEQTEEHEPVPSLRQSLHKNLDPIPENEEEEQQDVLSLVKKQLERFQVSHDQRWHRVGDTFLSSISLSST